MEQNENARTMPSESVQDEILASILQRLGGSGTAPSNTGGAVEVGASSGGGGNSGAANPLGDVFSSLLSNPELIAKLPVIISSVKPIIEMLGKGFSSGASVGTATEASGGTVTVSGASATPTASTDATVSAATLKDTSVHVRGSDSRTALLCAIKPYLSDDRRNAVDYIVKLSRLGEILKTL